MVVPAVQTAPKRYRARFTRKIDTVPTQLTTMHISTEQPHSPIGRTMIGDETLLAALKEIRDS